MDRIETRIAEVTISRRCRAVALGILLVLLHPLAAGEASGREPPAELLLEIEHGTDAGKVVEAARTLVADYRRHALAGQAAEILGDYHYARGEYKTAAGHYGMAAEMTTKESERNHRLLLRGRSILAAGDPDAAREQFEEILRSAPRNVGAGLGLADAAAMAGDGARAAQLYRAVLAEAPESDEAPMALAQLIRTLDGLDREEEALAAARRLVEDYPRASEAAPARERLRVSERQEGKDVTGGDTAPAATGDTDPGATEAEGEPPGTLVDEPEGGPADDSTGGATGGYTLQMGAFGSQENAQDFVLKLEGLGLPAVRIEEEARGTRTFYRVRSGDYADRESAEAEGKRLHAAHGLSYQVIAPEE